MSDNPPQQVHTVTDKDAQGITRVQELAYELKVEEVMSRTVKALTPGMHIIDVLEMFRQGHISGAPVVENDQLVGVVSIEDLIRILREGSLEALVGDYMTHKVITIRPSDPVVDALKIFVNVNVGRLPVLDAGGRLVGIITKGDITRGLLEALQRDYHVEELIRYRASHLFEDIISDRTSLVLRYKINPGDFKNGGKASSNIKRALLRLGASPQIARRCGIAIYEAEMNLIIHTSHGGTIRVDIEQNHISMEAYDDGPGIKDIHLAMKPGWSTATEEVREQGFGAGMGLTNIQRCVDEMTLESSIERGTNLRMKIYLSDAEVFGEPQPPQPHQENP